jgi:hypothetical protein
MSYNKTMIRISAFFLILWTGFGIYNLTKGTESGYWLAALEFAVAIINANNIRRLRRENGTPTR